MRLTVETGPLAGTVVALDRDQPTTLGSGPDCGLRVQEAGVQPEHAVVKALRTEGFGLKALAPGVRVNGEQIEATPLNDGDVIQIGTTRIAFGETQKQGLPTISGYRIHEELGRGGMGVVYSAEQVSLHRQVALKVLSHELTEDGKFVSNFVAEAQAAAKLQHPNVVSVFDVEHDGDTYYYAMELMQNGSCEDWLKQNGAMPVDRALQVIADAAAGLAYAESLGIVHRDIKPDNLMLDQHGVVKIADLGLAGADAESEERAVGTPHFMAPEQVLRRGIDHRADIYALGCTFYRLVTGRTPFRGQTVKDILRAQVKDDPEPAHKVNNKVPAEVATVIQRMMQKDPLDRFQTANELLEEVEILLRPPVKKGLWIALAAIAVIAGGSAIYWGATKKGETVTEKVYYDDPEKQRFADENVALKRQAKEDKATIALLEVRVSGLEDEPLAQAFDKVAREHGDTAAAGEARQRAQRVRTEVATRQQREQARKQAVSDYVAELEKNIAPQLVAHDYALALASINGAPPATIADEPELEQMLGALRERVITAAGNRLDELAGAVTTAINGGEREPLETATTTLADNLAARLRWPEALHPRLDTLAQTVTAGKEAITLLQRARRAGLWDAYEALFKQNGAATAALAKGAFDAAATAIDAFAATVPNEPPGVHAAGISAAVRRAGSFQQRLVAAAANGQLQLTIGDDTLTSKSWDPPTGKFMFTDAKNRSTRQREVAASSLSVNDWFELSSQVDGIDHDRACFRTFVLLRHHAIAATRYLGTVEAANDDSGTAADAYQLAPDRFELLRRNIEDVDEPWANALRTELLAGQQLAAGLRAFSERRNTAAAGYLDKLLGEHTHSYVVMVLP